jgi:hypothetical protein
MKIRIPKSVLTGTFLLGLLAVVAWSPPAGDYIVKIGWPTTTNFKGFTAADNGTISTTVGGLTGYACVIGNGHQVSSRQSIVSGANHTSLSSGALITGYNNYVGSPGGSQQPPAIQANHSAAIGDSNKVLSAQGWTMGYWSEVTGTRGMALGSGTSAANADSTAIGRYNAPMTPNTVLDIGSGSNTNYRFTALRVTDDGGVVLGRAQGDISMGDYE